MIDLSTKVDGNGNTVAGGIGSKSEHNSKDKSKIWKYIIQGVVLIVVILGVIGILIYTGHVDKGPLYIEAFAKMIGR